jgi:hypothetical protein
MFGWSRPRCPLDPPDKAWIERRMTWLAHALGVERCRSAPVALPTPEFFPDPYDGEEADVRPLLERVCGYMGVDPGRFDLQFFDGRADDDRDPWDAMSAANGNALKSIAPSCPIRCR